MNKFFKIFFPATCYLLLATPVAFATNMFFAVDRGVYAPGEQISANLMVESPDEKINAFEGTVTFPRDLLELIEVYDNNSMVTAWVEKPQLGAEGVHFSGIIVGGFDGVIDPFNQKQKKAGAVVRFVFMTKALGEGQLDIAEGRVYLHDGAGTEGRLTVIPLSFAIKEGHPAFGGADIIDDNPPEPFDIILDRHELIFDGQYFITFDARDRETGIAYYKIKEGGRPWTQGQSPYLLRDQNLSVFIKVKAVDKAGNERVAQLLPYARPDYSLLWWALGALAIILLLHLLLSRRSNIYNIGIKYEERLPPKK